MEAPILMLDISTIPTYTHEAQKYDNFWENLVLPEEIDHLVSPPALVPMTPMSPGVEQLVMPLVGTLNRIMLATEKKIMTVQAQKNVETTIGKRLALSEFHKKIVSFNTQLANLESINADKQESIKTRLIVLRGESDM